MLPLRHDPDPKPGLRVRAVKFVVVGGTGAVLNTVILYVLFRWPGVPLVVASALGAELAVVNNYLLNERWTFAATAPSPRRFAKFNAASLGGLAVNAPSVWFLARLALYISWWQIWPVSRLDSL